MVIQQEMLSAKADIAGLVIAGGKSTRFGHDKYKAEFMGRNLLEIVLERLSAQTATIAVNVPENIEGLPCDILVDESIEQKGPLSAILLGLEWAKAQNKDWLVTMPVDVPCFPDDFVDRLIVANKGQGAYVTANDGAHPLCALWPVSVNDQVEAALRQNKNAVYKCLRSIGANPCSFDDSVPECFFNINTVNDLRVLETILE